MAKFELKPRPRKRSENPVYMSDSHTEYFLKKSDDGMWRIVMHGGGFTPKPLKGKYTSKQVAEKALISWLIRHNKFGEAIYPGCARKQPNSTAPTSRV